MESEIKTAGAPEPQSNFTRAKLADIAVREANFKTKWTPGSDADKYKKKFWPLFGKGKWSWCAAFVTWCAEQAGLKMPIKCPSKFGYTFALVEGWQQWAIEKGFYFDNDGVFQPERGDITCFDWNQANINEFDLDFENHMGVHIRMEGVFYLVAEGNHENQTDLAPRRSRQIQGWIRIPDGYNFTHSELNV